MRNVIFVLPPARDSPSHNEQIYIYLTVLMLTICLGAEVQTDKTQDKLSIHVLTVIVQILEAQKINLKSL